MSEIVPGRGIMITKQPVWVNGYEIQASEVSVGFIDLDLINILEAQPGQVLMYDTDGQVKWKTPFDSDAELRREYPALEEAWGSLMEALEEYQMVKKLVQDHK